MANIAESRERGIDKERENREEGERNRNVPIFSKLLLLTVFPDF